MTSCIKIINGSLFLGLKSLCFGIFVFAATMEMSLFHQKTKFPSRIYLMIFLMIASLTPFRFFIVLHHFTSGCFLKVSADTILSSLSEWISKNSVIQQDQHQFCIFIWRSRVLSFRFGISFSTSLIINQEQVDNCSAIHEGL